MTHILFSAPFILLKITEKSTTSPGRAGYETLRYKSNFTAQCRASAFVFFNVKIPLKAAYFEEEIHHKVDCEPLVRFDLAVKIPSKTW
jgi:hypothetical protein